MIVTFKILQNHCYDKKQGTDPFDLLLIASRKKGHRTNSALEPLPHKVSANKHRDGDCNELKPLHKHSFKRISINL